MAELTIQAGHTRKRGGRRSKKSSTRVDLTPMVDLGFLLITFFILTTTWSKPHATNLNMPAKGDSSAVGREAALTLVALGNDKIFYYHGDLGQALKEGRFGITGYNINGGIGDIIREKQAAMDRSYNGGRKEMILLFKPTPEASYKNVISMLDEALINQVKRYAFEDLTPEEKRSVEKTP
ncbi:MAG TPA: biopolymer transporter ExbD [Puia sp.]|nr:biopolymer transporter ExbD [Puia sp.]